MVVRFHFSDPIFLTFPMPITGPPQLQPVTQDEFARLDYQVMRLAFESQNQLGRLCEEAVYQEDLLARLRVAGIPADKEVSDCGSPESRRTRRFPCRSATATFPRPIYSIWL